MISMAKKNVAEIIESIFLVLDDDVLKSLSEIADKTNSNASTIGKYVEIIEDIQKRPRIIVEKTKTSILVKKIKLSEEM